MSRSRTFPLSFSCFCILIQLSQTLQVDHTIIICPNAGPYQNW
uniref:Uncharacterized protein n=1 Tax=Anguilla anguilla TaxID=7936 RepID=A0A0E9PKJ6_ANGAN